MSTFPETIPEILEWRAAQNGRAPWLFFESDSWTLDDVLTEVDRFAVGLAERGVVKGDRVAILLGNRPETLFAWFAANRLGAIAAPLNPAYKPAELAGVLALLKPRILIDDAALANFDRAGSGAPRVDVSPDDVAVLLATSGTTGLPKAVMQTHRTYALTAEAFPWWIGLDSSDRLLATLPLFHVNAQAYSTLGALGCGASLALVPRFSASRFWEDAKRLGATHVNAVGAMIHILLQQGERPAEREHALRSVYTALALPEVKHVAFEKRFGVSMTVGYALSESTFGTIWPRGNPRPFGTMGTLRQHPRLGVVNRARVVDDEERDVADGVVGELWLDNPAIFRGYFEDETATVAARSGPWLRTGDLVTRGANGNFTFVARKKDVIRRRGENVAAAEIERVLEEHPAVREAAVIGVPSPLGEEDIVAFVAPRAGMQIDVVDVAAFVRERLADFKVPREIRVVDSLPRTATERIAKHLLRRATD